MALGQSLQSLLLPRDAGFSGVGLGEKLVFLHLPRVLVARQLLLSSLAETEAVERLSLLRWHNFYWLFEKHQGSDSAAQLFRDPSTGRAVPGPCAVRVPVCPCAAASHRPAQGRLQKLLRAAAARSGPAQALGVRAAAPLSPWLWVARIHHQGGEF